MLEHYREAASGKPNTEARNIAASIVGSDIDWDWDCTSFTLHLHSLRNRLYAAQRRAHAKDTTTPLVGLMLRSPERWRLRLMRI